VLVDEIHLDERLDVRQCSAIHKGKTYFVMQTLEIPSLSIDLIMSQAKPGDVDPAPAPASSSGPPPLRYSQFDRPLSTSSQPQGYYLSISSPFVLSFR
jgi:hypothetical protein